MGYFWVGSVSIGYIFNELWDIFSMNYGIYLNICVGYELYFGKLWDIFSMNYGIFWGL